MESYNNFSENSSNTEKMALEELIRGREYTTQLQAILQNPPAASTVAENLVVKILESLNDTLSTLMNSSESNDVFEDPWGSLDTLKSEDSSESCKTFEFKGRRGCYKRRRTSETWKKVTSALIDDGHSWRKYGQKVILNSKHPRNYYRCTHKFDQECKATKQVQMIEDDPVFKYQTTYYGRHTCKSLHKPSQIIVDSADDKDSSIYLSFGSNNLSNKQSSPAPLSFPSSPVTKQKTEEEIQAPFDYSLQTHYFDRTYERNVIMATPSGSDHGEVICSSVGSPSSFDLDMMVEPIAFGDFGDFGDFNFDQIFMQTNI